ncbi:MAG: PaREP1 family protein [Candidatus Baldrarchaeia archaeon]
MYKKLHEKYLQEAEDLYRKNDLPQAGEKYWGSLIALLNVVGEKEKLPHYTHRDLREIAEFLTKKTNDPEFSRLFSSAEALHANFYHNFMSRLSFDAHREDLLKLVRKIKEYLGSR